MSYHFAFSYCSWGSQGKNTEVVCHSLLQWTTFCQTSPPWPAHLGWPHMAWLRFIELDKAVVHVIRLTSFLWLWFQCVCPLMPSRNTSVYPFLNNNSGKKSIFLSHSLIPVVLWKSFTVWGFSGWIFRAPIMPPLSRLSLCYWPCVWEERGWLDWPWTVEKGRTDLEL